MMILLTGAGGRVGRFLESALQERFADRVMAATREEMDLRDAARLAMEIERLDPPPTVAINCAALTEPQGAEAEPSEHTQVNRDGVAALARACREVRCRLIHLSTVDVFSGASRTPYREEDAPDTGIQYGKIRHLGELAAAQENPDHLVLRMSMLCGDGEEGDPLLVMLRALREGGTLAWHDRLVTPLWMADFVSALQTILRSDWKGVLHLGNGGSCLLSDMVEDWGRQLRIDKLPELIGGPGPASFWEASGRNAALDTTRFSRLSGRRLRDWRMALAAHAGGGA
jgi:dTDP-4-dehydrorhamnose reductase